MSIAKTQIGDLKVQLLVAHEGQTAAVSYFDSPNDTLKPLMSAFIMEGEYTLEELKEEIENHGFEKSIAKVDFTPTHFANLSSPAAKITIACNTVRVVYF